ncbi:MAG: ATP-dependent helicase HrpB [Elusimicrobia bacterium]|nr:ATP-dependent helicase HrpB [Elusimicrobiota bacterium]
MSQPLPITTSKDRIVAALAGSGALILSAPTGSGKSTQTPQFLLRSVPGKLLILEPRRLAARSLAARVAAETGATLGREVGYQVRFDNRAGPDTKAVFQTYGVFVQQLLKDPGLKGVAAVLLDEFHERTLEADLALAWLRTLRKARRPDLKVVVMSATLDAGALSSYLRDAARVDVPGRLYPVDIRHQPLDARDTPPDGALKALRALAAEGLDGSVLVFMPGLREIRRTLERLGPFCREQGLALQPLHGSMEPAEQQRVLAPEGNAPRVIVATNVAETGLTIPGVTMVVDSGLHRLAAYSPARGVNTLTVAHISRANAAQRAGRAGRTAPGRCVRLWGRTEEMAMAEGLAPEVSRLELSPLLLQASSLPDPVEWLTPLPEAARKAATACLLGLSAVDAQGRITAEGRSLLGYPLPPRLAAVLEGARTLGWPEFERACAMAAVFETAAERRPDKASDLSELAEDLEGGSREDLSWEAVEAFKQLKRLGGRDLGAVADAAPDALARVWLKAFSDRLAAREGDGRVYRLADGSGVMLPVERGAPQLILALDIRERGGGGQARQVGVTLYLPLSVQTVRDAFSGECVWTEVSEFDDKKQRVVKEERLLLGGLVLERREAARKKEDRKATAEMWAEKFAAGELRHPGLDEAVLQLVTRIRVARGLYPDLGFPEMDADDWRLVYGEVCAGRNTLFEIERVALAPHILAYIGKPLASFLDKMLPTGKRLPSGKNGRITYFEGRPPELSARLGDFLKMTGTLALCDGRLSVLFDILAPNYRTVQKTHDLSSFWKNTYPEVKKELKRRYPRHPWP